MFIKAKRSACAHAVNGWHPSPAVGFSRDKEHAVHQKVGAQLLTVAHEHSEFQRMTQYVADLLGSAPSGASRVVSEWRTQLEGWAALSSRSWRVVIGVLRSLATLSDDDDDDDDDDFHPQLHSREYRSNTPSTMLQILCLLSMGPSWDREDGSWVVIEYRAGTRMRRVTRIYLWTSSETRIENGNETA
ncbi:hypothetical protein EVAR_68888_1 [Eumeta japonica]|uniref:Uncharacterized protein n=1 Tax=Eumeta variegata TaxID=151549 RepID=A0A4C1ZYW6_EUMVA|nr:hypothetical protein EVAR_68888_1 [Eumeta japonica]